MKLRAVRAFRRAGEHVEPGTLLDVTSWMEAHQLVHGFGDCVFVDEVIGQPTSMTVGHADPVVAHRDPVAINNAARKGRRS